MADVDPATSFETSAINIEWNLEEYKLRAFICAEAVYYDSNEDAEQFLRQMEVEFSVRFTKVHVSRELYLEQKFLVAYADDATFIAFRGSTDSRDNVSYMDRIALREGYHDRVLSHADAMFPRSDHLNLYWLGSQRTIFCGHRLGGAVAHMVLLRALRLRPEHDHDQEEVSFSSQTGTMISIAFGAPFILDRDVASAVNRRDDVKRLFFNFVLRENPTSSMFSGYNFADSEDTFTPGPAYPGVVFHSIGEVEFLKRVQPDVPWPKATEEDWDHKEFCAAYRSALQPSSESFTGTFDSDHKLVFTPAPKVIRTKWMQDETGKTLCIQIEGENLRFVNKPVMFNGSQTCITYVESDSEVLIIPDPELSDAPNNEASNFLTITTAFGGTTRAIIEDSQASSGALSKMLRRIVQICDVMATDPPMSTTPQTAFTTTLDGIVQCVPSFEEVDRPLSTLLREIADFYKSSDATTDAEAMMRKRISGEVNDIVTKVTEYLTSSFEVQYDEKVPFYKYKVEKVQDKMKYILTKRLSVPPEWVDNVVSKIAPSGSNPNYCKWLVFGATLLTVAAGVGIFMVSTTILASIYGVGTVMGCIGGTSTAMAIYLNNQKILIPDYADVLKLAIEEASDWCKLEAKEESYQAIEEASDWRKLEAKEESYQVSNARIGEADSSSPIRCAKHEESSESPQSTHVGTSSEEDSDLCIEAMLEAKLYETVTCHEKYFKKLLENEGELTKRKMASPLFDGATLISKKKLLNKMKIVKDTIYLHNIQEKRRFVVVVGEEDAGKTTFIKNALLQYNKKSIAETLVIGNLVHTKIVRCYDLGGFIWLVDFPGGNGIKAYADAWKQYTALPSSCVLLLNFQFDIKDNQRQLYETMKKELETKITVVFNKVDEKFRRRDKPMFNKSNFAKLAETANKSLKFEGDETVHYACLDPELDLQSEEMTTLRGIGIKGYEEIASLVLKDEG